MPAPKRDDLFRQAGPEAVLQYLRSRLDARDLTRDEALALLSALHEQLGRSEAGDPRMYASYGRFMAALEQEMPAIHGFVVSEWAESRHPQERGENVPDTTWGAEEELAGSGDATYRAAAAGQFHEVTPAVQPESHEAEGSGEPGEPDEEDDSEQAQPARGGGQQESGEDESEEVDAEPEILDEAEDSMEDEQLEEASDQEEIAEAAESESEPQEELDDAEESGQPEAAAPEGDQEPGEKDTEGAGDFAEGGGEAAGGEQGEWPAQEAPEPGEALEDFEGEEGEPPAAE